MTQKKILESDSATEMPRDGFSVDNRGYIHGGFDTPIFLKVKQKHNTLLTNKRNNQKAAKRKGANAR